MQYTSLAELTRTRPELNRINPALWYRTEILLVGDDRRKAESEILRRQGWQSVDEVFVVRDSKEALDVLCRLREYEYRRNGRDLRVVLLDSRSDHADLGMLADRLQRTERVAHFPIVRAVEVGDRSVAFEAVHYHQFEDLLDSTRACCVLLWQNCRMAA